MCVMNRVCAGILLITTSVFAFGQQPGDNNPLINSGDLIRKGIEYHDNEKYDSAIYFYNQVDRNDTNYTMALYEKSFSCHSNKDYAGSIKACREALAIPYSETVDLYITLGSSLDDSGNVKEALKTYEQGLDKYPYSYLLRYNYALTLNKDKQTEKAYKEFQTAIDYNYFHASSYLALGNLYYKQGRKIPAMLALGMFLTLEPNTERAFKTTKLLKSIADGSMSEDKDVEINIPADDAKYAYLTEILESKVANDSRYKTGIDINDILINQYHVILDNLKYDEKDTSFLSQKLVSYMKELFTKGYFEPFICFVYNSFNNESINKLTKKNEKAITSFKDWRNSKISDLNAMRNMMIDGKLEHCRCYYTRNGRLESFGKITTKNKEELKQGTWIYLFNTGNIQNKAFYNSEGKLEGNCKVWYNNGTLLRDFYYVNGKQEGPFLQYYDDGVLRYKTTYKNDLLNGELYSYSNTGAIRSIEKYVNDTTNGMCIYYTSNADKSSALKQIKGKTDSLAVYYYPSGKISSTSWFKDDVRSGESVFYYENGTIQHKGLYNNGKQVGQWFSYWENGKLMSDVTYNEKGEQNGPNKQYTQSGVLNEDYTYLNDKVNGKAFNYTDDGKLWYTIEYKNGNIKKLTNYTALTGAVCAEFEDKGKRIPITFMTPACKKQYEGMFFEGKRDGDWKHYYANGNKFIEESYDKGNRQGLYTKYFKIGGVDTRINYTDDNLNGYYQEFYQSGVPYSEGWYRNDQKQGYWYYYGPTGIVLKKLYFLDNDYSGYQTYYKVDGKIDFEMYYRNGVVNKYFYYDTTGQVVYENDVPHGNGHIIATYFNGKKRFEGEMKYGMFNGAFKRYYPKGEIQEELNYNAGDIQGVVKDYYQNGKISQVSNYKNGSLDGLVLWYYKNGKVQCSGSYKKGDQDSIWNWYDELGRKYLTRNFKEGKLDGDETHYDSTGTAQMRITFEHDDIVSYTYLDKNSQFKPAIPIENETAKIKALYPNGTVSAEIEYEKGVIVGDFVQYYQSGKKMRVKPFIKNKVNGAIVSYYENGKIRSSIPYLSGDIHGKAMYYRPDGSLEKIERYYLDERHGLTEYFDAKGNVTKKEKYVYDILFE